MDTRVFLINLFKLFIEMLSENAVSQRTPSKVLVEVLEEARADNLNRWEIYSFDCGSDIHSEEIKKHIESTPYQYLLFGHAPAKKRISSLAENQFLSSNFKTFYRNEIARHQLQGTPHQFLESLRSQLQSLYDLKLDLDSLSLYNDRENLATPISLPGEEVDVSPKEGELQQGVETTNLQALKEFEDSVEKKLKSSEDTSDVFNKAVSLAVSLTHDICKASQKGVAPEEIKEALQQTARALPKKGDIFSHQPKQEKALQPPDLSGIPLWQGSKRGEKVKALNFLKTHYGQWLSVYGADQDSVFQDQIRAHDPDLIKGIDNQLRREGKRRTEGKRLKVSDFVKTRSARMDRELENVSDEDLKRIPQLAGVLYMRGKRAADKAKAAPSRSSTRK